MNGAVRDGDPGFRDSEGVGFCAEGKGAATRDKLGNGAEADLLVIGLDSRRNWTRREGEARVSMAVGTESNHSIQIRPRHQSLSSHLEWSEIPKGGRFVQRPVRWEGICIRLKHWGRSRGCSSSGGCPLAMISPTRFVIEPSIRLWPFALFWRTRKAGDSEACDCPEVVMVIGRSAVRSLFQETL